MTADKRCDAILLIGFGGPEKSDEIRPFLDRVLEGRTVPRERYEAVVHHYEVLGGRSPYNELTRRQADALRFTLERHGIDVPVLAGLRNAAPFFEDALRRLSAHGSKRLLGFILSPFHCEASWERYQNGVAAAAATIGEAAPAMVYPAAWHLRPGFIATVSERVRAALVGLREADRGRAELIFTAHSIPLAMAARAPYVDQLRASAEAVAETIGNDRWSIAYQSRSGDQREPWLEPDIRDALVANTAPKIVMPIGFLIDHVEVLYDLDIEAAHTAHAAGIAMVRAGTVGDHPGFIELMAEIVREHL